jgi:molybdopterin molybdotransferase
MAELQQMISFENALGAVLSLAEKLKMPEEAVMLQSAAGRILRQEVFADVDMPPFDKSAVDGFACRAADIPAAVQNCEPLRVVETIPAGKIPARPVLRGECSKIMTGAMVPPGADRVIMVEDTRSVTENMVLIVTSGSNTNICYRGEDIRTGERVLEAGTRIAPAHIAVLAGMGVVNPVVSCLPHVGIISTGDEIVEPVIVPAAAQIRNSNAPQLMAQAGTLPAKLSYYGIAPDEGNGLRGILERALGENDIVLLTGGVSMGDFDLVPEVMRQAGINILFEKIAVQPGKPTVFGHRGGSVVFGLPGNPVSSFVIFEMLVRPFILRLAGCRAPPAELVLSLGSSYSRRNTARKALIPVSVKDNSVYPAEYHGSAHIHAYTVADGIMFVETGIASLNKGDPVHVRLI